MRLRGITFPPVMNASGAQGFFGEGYPYHRYWKFAGLTFAGCGFIAKTTTFDPRPGNMPLRDDGITPREFIPQCIVTRPLRGVALNAVGLSGPGAWALLRDGRWQCREKPFFLSCMSVADTVSDRLTELRSFIQCLRPPELLYWDALIGLEMNFSCPNVGLDPAHLIDEIGHALDIAARLRIPLQVKLNALVPPRVACEVATHEACDAITMGNTIPWGARPCEINWRQLFGTTTSPLRRRGFSQDGGLSGPPLFPLVCRWIEEARDCGLAKPVWACGGIDSEEAVRRAAAAGADGIQIGTVAMLRPWRMRSIIRAAYDTFDP